MPCYSTVLTPLACGSPEITCNLTPLSANTSISLHRHRSMQSSHTHYLHLLVTDFECFKCVGLLLTKDPTWTKYIVSIIMYLTRRILGLLCRELYYQSQPETLLHLYTLLVRPLPPKKTKQKSNPSSLVADKLVLVLSTPS